jgi:hypothetical protein
MANVSVTTALTGQTIQAGMFGLSCSMWSINHDYLPATDSTLWPILNQYPTGLLRHNWELNTFMDIVFPSRGSVNTPNFANLDNYLNNLASFRTFLPTSARIMVTLGNPSWLTTSSSADQTLLGQMAVTVAKYFVQKNAPVTYWELTNEPNGFINLTDLCNMFNAVRSALKAYNASYKVGGLTYSFYIQADYLTFFQTCRPDFTSSHWYSTNDVDGNTVQTCLNSAANFTSYTTGIRADMTSAGLSPTTTEIFVGEYNFDGGNFSGVHNNDYVGAVHGSTMMIACAMANVNVTMGAMWETVNDGTYAQYGGAAAYGYSGYGAKPGGVTLSKLAQAMAGPQLSLSGLSGRLVGLATKQPGGHAVALVNYDVSATIPVNLTLAGATASAYTSWELGSNNQTTPLIRSIAASGLATLSIPPISTVVITSQGGGLPPGTTGLDKTTISGSTLAAKTVSYPGVFGRVRDVALGQDGSLYFCTSNADSIGGQVAGSDRIYKTPPT